MYVINVQLHSLSSAVVKHKSCCIARPKFNFKPFSKLSGGEVTI